MSPRQRRGPFGITWQQCEERFEALFVEAELRRELPEDRTEFCAEAQHTPRRRSSPGAFAPGAALACG